MVAEMAGAVVLALAACSRAPLSTRISPEPWYAYRAATEGSRMALRTTEGDENFAGPLPVVAAQCPPWSGTMRPLPSRDLRERFFSGAVKNCNRITRLRRTHGVPYWSMLLRPAEPDDAMAVARMHIRTWQVAYRNLIPDEFLDGLNPEDRARRYDFATRDPQKPRTILAVEEGSILGFATTSPSRDADLPEYGELCALYVDPPHWGRGIGNALIAAARSRLWEMGFRSALLWVLAGNERAERFYRADQWVPDGHRRSDSTRGVTLHEIRYQRALEGP
jgi:GNAT superfamily N-acetyltransferase